MIGGRNAVARRTCAAAMLAIAMRGIASAFEKLRDQTVLRYATDIVADNVEEWTTAEPNVEMIRVDDLRLDPENPRLPEEVRNQPQPAILRFLFENMALEELAASFIANGYLSYEPLLVVRNSDGTSTVIEGNRRLATLKLLRRSEDADGLEFDLDSQQLAKFEQIRPRGLHRYHRQREGDRTTWLSSHRRPKDVAPGSQGSFCERCSGQGGGRG
jgi:hypothetical protein